jgi:hypothetical protein
MADYFDDDDIDEAPAPQEQASNPVKELRSQLRKLEKENKELNEFRAQAEAEKAQALTQNVFTEAGVDPKRAKYWRADNPEAEPTKETVRQWAVAEGFEVAEAVEAEVPTEQGFTPSVIPEGSLVTTVIDGEKALEMLMTDPERLEREYLKGRIQLEKLPGNL